MIDLYIIIILDYSNSSSKCHLDHAVWTGAQQVLADSQIVEHDPNEDKAVPDGVSKGDESVTLEERYTRDIDGAP